MIVLNGIVIYWIAWSYGQYLVFGQYLDSIWTVFGQRVMIVLGTKRALTEGVPAGGSPT